MSLIQRLADVVRGRSTSYICRFCRLSFERERRNCPACGCGTVELER